MNKRRRYKAKRRRALRRFLVRLLFVPVGKTGIALRVVVR